MLVRLVIDVILIRWVVLAAIYVRQSNPAKVRHESKKHFLSSLKKLSAHKQQTYSLFTTRQCSSCQYEYKKTYIMHYLVDIHRCVELILNYSYHYIFFKCF